MILNLPLNTTFNFILIAVFLSFSNSYANSGGPLTPEQAAYDVNYYNLDLRIDPALKTISGSLLCRAKIVNTINTFVLDLDSVFNVSSILFKKNNGEFSSTTFDHALGKLNINIPETVAPEDLISVQVFYNGTPKTAVHPPWGCGFIWGNTQSGKQWIGVASEEDGADIWWPCKDHPSDEPDSMSMSFTVPNPLKCVSNGRFLGSIDNGDNTSTYNWYVSTPINNYDVTLYISEYSLIEDTYQSVSGKQVPFYFWVLPEYYNAAINYMDVFREEFDVLESIFGPFPFGTDKHGWAQAPYIGMEHQTIVAYGSNFTQISWGYDYIHYHEMAHEWWGNFITAKDWSDLWIHEGIASYAEALFVERDKGREEYLHYMEIMRPENNHILPLAPRESLTAEEAFNGLNPYSRGAAVMHTLRYHLGDDKFFNLLKRWLYPDPSDMDNTNGRLCRILSTDDMKNLAEEITGVNLDPFFEVFFRERFYPILNILRGTNEASFTWSTENNVPLDLDIPIIVNGIPRTVDMIDGKGTSAISINDNLIIDPENWILMDEPDIVTSVDDKNIIPAEFTLEQNYPNPFNPSTKINYSIANRSFVTLKIYDLLGKEIDVLVKQVQSPGKYTVEFDASNIPSGVYFYSLSSGGFKETKKMILTK